jgi:hypothetical protein
MDFNIQKSINEIKKRSQKFFLFIKDRKLEKNENKCFIDNWKIEF